MPRWQKVSLGIAALLAWIVLEGVSIAANMKFASTFGASELERSIMMAAGAASDLLKAASPVALLYFIATRQRLGAFATVLLGSVAIVFSLMAALGFMASERYRHYYEAADKVSDTKRLQSDITKLESDRGWLPTQKPLSVLQAEMRGAEADPLYVASVYCTKQVGKQQENHCRRMSEIGVQIAAAEEVKKADAKIEAKREVIVKEGRSYGDAQIEMLAERTGLSEKTILAMMIVLGVLLIELGSGFGLTIALGLLTTEQSALGRVVGTAFSVIRRKEPAAPAAAVAAAPPSPAPRPAAPRPEAFAAAVKDAQPPLKAVANFVEPVADIPEVGGLRDLIKPVTRKVPVMFKVA